MTESELKRLAALALDVAAAAPWPENRRTFSTRIPWTLVERIRGEFEAAGFDWQKFKREREAR